MKPTLAITMGDPAGVGPEIVVKVLSSRTIDRARIIVVGDVDSLSKAMNETGCNVKFAPIASVAEVADCDGIPILEPIDVDHDMVTTGTVSAEAGRAAVGFFETAVDLALSRDIQGVVTCPINKAAVHAAGFIGDIGHQEILARKTGSSLTATMLMTEGLKVAHLSTHKSLAEAVAYVQQPVLMDKLRLTVSSLEGWCGAQNQSPKVAVAALNPHGGEEGMLGREEIEEIAPAIAQLQEEGLDVVGPYPADSIFYRATAGEFDAVLALYHDQGHIAVKVHNFEDSITATMGIPFVRTSVDHGTAFDIAGLNKANENGLVRALDAAVDMVNGTLT